MSQTLHVTISDNAYRGVQGTIEVVCRVLLDPKYGLGAPALDLFIERAQRSLAVGPVLHPSEFRAGAEKLQEIVACAQALREARDKIAEAAERSGA